MFSTVGGGGGGWVLGGGGGGGVFFLASGRGGRVLYKRRDLRPPHAVNSEPSLIGVLLKATTYGDFSHFGS